MRVTSPVAVGLVACAACSGVQRGPQEYRLETRKALESHSAQLQACYEQVLKADAGARGLVSVRFVIERKTGLFGRVVHDPAGTSAPEPVVECVLRSIDGLVLAPPDRNDGHASFVYELRPAP